MKDFKYKTSFSSTIKPLISEDKDKYLALASLVEVSEFIPDVDTEKEIDLLPIAFNACVANRVNKNGDVIDAQTALASYQSFINKPINIEHNRQRVVGVILTAGFSEFGTDKPLEAQAASELNSPFNITLGGVVWKVVNSDLTDLIEESGDPTSESYQSISASWELGFTDYNLVVLNENEKNIENATIISDKEEVNSLKENLRIFGGTGKMKDGRSLYRQVIKDIVPLGIGLTETPAADVKGVAVKKKEDACLADSEETKINTSSHSNEKNVNTERTVMKITSLKDINEENLKELQASEISDFIEQELEKASEQFVAEKQKTEESLKAANEQIEKLQNDAESAQKGMSEVREQLAALEQEKTEKEAEAKFNERMSQMDEEYELTDEDREVIASDIKDMDEDAFEGYQNKMAVLLRKNNKKELEAAAKAQEEAEVKAAEEAKANEEAKTEEAPKAEAEEAEEDANAAVEEALDSAEAEAAEVPASTTVEEPSVYEKYKKAFEFENWIQK